MKRTPSGGRWAEPRARQVTACPDRSAGGGDFAAQPRRSAQDQELHMASPQHTQAAGNMIRCEQKHVLFGIASADR